MGKGRGLDKIDLAPGPEPTPWAGAPSPFNGRVATLIFASHSGSPSRAEPAFLIDGRAGNAIMSPLLALNTRQL